MDCSEVDQYIRHVDGRIQQIRIARQQPPNVCLFAKNGQGIGGTQFLISARGKIAFDYNLLLDELRQPIADASPTSSPSSFYAHIPLPWQAVRACAG